jgi:hypothetical protein
MAISIKFARGIATIENGVWSHEDEATRGLLNSIARVDALEWKMKHSAEEAYGDEQKAKQMAAGVKGTVLL